MARRKKEAPAIHRERIASAARTLFHEKGFSAVSMDDIANKAGYSKATLYVYFQNKEAILSLLALQSMSMLYDSLQNALAEHTDTKKRYDAICAGLLSYARTHPYYFELVLSSLRTDVTPGNCLPEEAKTYAVGEQINTVLSCFLEEGMQKGDLRPDLPLLPTLFSFWGMLAGLIRLSDSKEAYIRQSMGLDRDAFLQFGFDTLYRSIQTYPV